jgi:hypothetical protein
MSTKTTQKYDVKCDDCSYGWTVETIETAIQIADEHSVERRNADEFHTSSITPAKKELKSIYITNILKKAGITKSRHGRNGRIGYSTRSTGFSVEPMDFTYGGFRNGKYVKENSRLRVDYQNIGTDSSIHFYKNSSDEARAKGAVAFADMVSTLENAGLILQDVDFTRQSLIVIGWK